MFNALGEEKRVSNEAMARHLEALVGNGQKNGIDRNDVSRQGASRQFSVHIDADRARNVSDGDLRGELLEFDLLELEKARAARVKPHFALALRHLAGAAATLFQRHESLVGDLLIGEGAAGVAGVGRDDDHGLHFRHARHYALHRHQLSHMTRSHHSQRQWLCFFTLSGDDMQLTRPQEPATRKGRRATPSHTLSAVSSHSSTSVAHALLYYHTPPTYHGRKGDNNGSIEEKRGGKRKRTHYFLCSSACTRFMFAFSLVLSAFG